MSQSIFEGVGTALITPFAKDGSVNFKKLRELVDFQVQNGVAAIVACGTTGENSTLDNEEHVAVIKEVIQVVNKRVPVVAGTGSNDTRYGVQLSQEAERLGADALLLVTPYYNKTSQSGLIEHYRYIADRVSVPMILYNVPSRTGLNIKPETYAALCTHPNIAGIKESNSDFSALARTVALCQDNITVFSGNDDQGIPIISLGGKGVISVFANIAPRIMSDIVGKALAGDFSGAVSMQNRYIIFMNHLFADVNPTPIKEAMNIAGFDVGNCRLPLGKPSADLTELLRADMTACGLL